MPKKQNAVAVTSKFKSLTEAERKATFTRQMAAWINGMEQAKQRSKP